MVKIRLKRMGAHKKPVYRIVVADSRSPRDGKFIEEIGFYNPLKDPAEITVKAERAAKWLKDGAQPTETVRALLKKSGVLDKNGKLVEATEADAAPADAADAVDATDVADVADATDVPESEDAESADV